MKYNVILAYTNQKPNRTSKYSVKFLLTWFLTNTKRFCSIISFWRQLWWNCLITFDISGRIIKSKTILPPSTYPINYHQSSLDWILSTMWWIRIFVVWSLRLSLIDSWKLHLKYHPFCKYPIDLPLLANWLFAPHRTNKVSRTSHADRGG